MRIVINVAKTLHGSRRSAEPLDGMAEPVDPRAIVGRDLDLAEAREQVRQAVAGLPDRQRQVVLLKVFSEMTYKEVAEVMELSEGAVKAHLHQAVANLRRRMAPELSR